MTTVSPRVKYPRTKHLPSSRSKTDDDRIATKIEIEKAFFSEALQANSRVIITEKLDGESTTIYPDGHSHARSIDSKFHPSRSIIRELAGRLSRDIPKDFRICGENMYAVHSIEYSNLDSYFQVYNMWDDNICLSWADTLDWANLLELSVVPVLYDGPWLGEIHAKQMWDEFKFTLPEGQDSEGFVVRRADSFSLAEFENSIFKFVREDHITTDNHWMHSEMKVNGVK